LAPALFHDPLALVFDNFVGSTTFTAGTRSATVTYAGPSRDLSVVNNKNGTITVRTAFTGKIGIITDGTGQTRDVTIGRVVNATVLDFNGTPGDADDDTFLSQTVEAQSGQISQQSFCDVISAVLFG
jgi:hypothetical protein